jgi:hypothetical protein
MNLNHSPVDGPGDWALKVAETLGASEYINPPGGVALFDPLAFADSNIKLTIQEPFEFNYECPGYQFVPHLSIIDALMWSSPIAIKSHLDRLKTNTKFNSF